MIKKKTNEQKYWGYIKQKNQQKKTPPNKKYSMWTKNSQFNNLTIIKEFWPLRRLKDIIYRYLKGSTLVEVKGKRKLIRKSDHLFQDYMLLQRGVLRTAAQCQMFVARLGSGFSNKADSLLQRDPFPSYCSS